MFIVTIKFAKGTKCYDYLVNNPNRNKIDRSRGLRIPINVQAHYTAYADATLIGYRKVDAIPQHVTKMLTICTGNVVMPEPIKQQPAFAKAACAVSRTPEPKRETAESPNEATVGAEAPKASLFDSFMNMLEQLRK